MCVGVLVYMSVLCVYVFVHTLKDATCVSVADLQLALPALVCAQLIIYFLVPFVFRAPFCALLDASRFACFKLPDFNLPITLQRR